jgi:hypothetical protein
VRGGSAEAGIILWAATSMDRIISGMMPSSANAAMPADQKFLVSGKARVKQCGCGDKKGLTEMSAKRGGPRFVEGCLCQVCDEPIEGNTERGGKKKSRGRNLED